MKTVSTLKSSRIDSPKTPGGISRSLLTPCRRVGLSRKFRISGASPFQSPLSSNIEVNSEKVETRKRKESLEKTLEIPENIDDSDGQSEVVETLVRNVDLPRRKKPKTLLPSINKTTEENVSETQEVIISPMFEDKSAHEILHKGINVQDEANVEIQSTPLCLKFKSRSKIKMPPSISIAREIPTVDLEKENLSKNPTSLETKDKIEFNEETKEKSPNNLTKQCVVVIQKKIFKKELKVHTKTLHSKEMPNDTTPKQKVAAVSQVLSDFDSDDVPLICHNNKEIESKLPSFKSIHEDEDFATNKSKSSKTETTKYSRTKNNSMSPTQHQSTKNKRSPKEVKAELHKPPNSHSSIDNDEDFFEKKKTILVRKSYNKVLKPQKAKSTGSITQKDIDDLKAKIEIKKKLLLAKGMTEDTKELRDLIKKWQKGCQDALMELMDLMKSKCSDKKNMDYSEMLQTLKIPASLVGYDSDNDYFHTPEDESIILAHI